MLEIDLRKEQELISVNLSASMQRNNPNAQWIYWAGRQLSIVISYAGSGFLSEEQLRQRIKERIKDPNVFN